MKRLLARLLDGIAAGLTAIGLAFGCFSWAFLLIGLAFIGARTAVEGAAERVRR